jgi:hypothetical protein
MERYRVPGDLAVSSLTMPAGSSSGPWCSDWDGIDMSMGLPFRLGSKWEDEADARQIIPQTDADVIL